MIVKRPKEEYEKLIYNEIANNPYYGNNEGDKSVLYDLAARYVPKYIYVNWKYIDLEFYLHTIKRVYDKTKNTEQYLVICNCINALFPNKKATAEGNLYERKIIIRDIPIS